MEINQVWLKKWDFIEIVYLFQRYAVVLDACVLAIYRQTGSDMTDVKCDRVKWIVAAVMVLGTLSSEVILTARVWALWNRTTRLLTVLCALGVVIWVPGVVGLYRFFVTVKAPPKPIYKGFHGVYGASSQARDTIPAVGYGVENAVVAYYLSRCMFHRECNFILDVSGVVPRYW
ncbi:hypothetical protein JR316_0009175 [Psilocybe cubensis]|uniref:Uncharacterized protein n=1 Tax=Psilocybe cubensis TaxID=181762 RepID=A0ACB8GUQ6_PSICU|nr:hypothetical protein JR316_0009175 [Psilocybe cubensis]KAH9478715.1 hypothetical protein JR316_0009175 [Psilocybe cubensis]